MSYRKHKVRFIVILGITLGILLVVIQNVFHIPQATLFRYYLIGAAVVLAAVIAINMSWQLRFQKKLLRLNRVLTDDHDPDRFIAENEDLMEKVKHPFHQSLLMINIAVGYSDKKDFKKAKKILLEIPEGGLRGINRIIYYNNLAYFHFHLGETKKAIRILEEHREEFDRLLNNQQLGKHIIINRVYQAIAEGDKNRAEQLLESLSDKRIDERQRDEMESLKKSIIELAGDTRNGRC